MKLVPLDDMTPKQWYNAWTAMYDPQLGDHIGVDPALTAAKPRLEDFYTNIMNAQEAGMFKAWAIMQGDKFKGYTLLDKTFGEWEIGTVLPDPADWNSGIGVRATLEALRWAFEVDKATWVVAFTQGKDPKVKSILHRGGFRPLAHFHVMDTETWHARWAKRGK